jgi:hypothetical protein
MVPRFRRVTIAGVPISAQYGVIEGRMRIIHRITITEDEAGPFQALGIKVPKVDQRFAYLSTATSFDVAEDHPHWSEVARLIKKFDAADIPLTKFTDEELASAQFLGFGAWHHGYPMPDDDFGYLDITYDPKKGCRECNVGLKQIAPFRMRREPVWGRRSFMQLIWVYDEFFVTPDVWKAIFKPFGIECRPVVKNKTGAVLETVVQLEIPEIVNLHLAKNYPYEICPICSRKKYHPGIPGFFPAPSLTDLPIFKSEQYFGSGGSAHKAVLVSNALYRSIEKAGLRGAGFYPCAALK